MALIFVTCTGIANTFVVRVWFMDDAVWNLTKTYSGLTLKPSIMVRLIKKNKRDTQSNLLWWQVGIFNYLVHLGFRSKQPYCVVTCVFSFYEKKNKQKKNNQTNKPNKTVLSCITNQLPCTNIHWFQVARELEQTLIITHTEYTQYQSIPGSTLSLSKWLKAF